MDAPLQRRTGSRNPPNPSYPRGDGPTLTDERATRAAHALDQRKVLDIVAVDSIVKVVMVVGDHSTTIHRLHPPTPDDLDRVCAVSFRRLLGNRISIMIEPAAALYDKLHVAHEGYVSRVPAIHESDVIMTLGLNADGQRHRDVRRAGYRGVFAG